MKKRTLLLFTVLITVGVFYGCSPKAKYEHRVKQELAKGVRYDSLFMGIYLGMPRKDFYTHCWMLNKKGIIKQGPNNTTVEFQLKNELKYHASMDFYPDFVEDKISEMPVRFAYTGWAPWNKTLSSENLQIDILNWYKKVYGSGFIKVKHPERGVAYVKVDGNRRISIFKEDDLYAWAIFTDLLVNKDSIKNNLDPGSNINSFKKDPEKK